MIIVSLKHTFKKTQLVYNKDIHDREERHLTEGVLPEKIQSHFDAIAEWMVSEAQKAYQEAVQADENQGKLDFDGDQNEEPEEAEEEAEEESEGYTVDDAESDGIPFEEEEPQQPAKDWSSERVPMHPNTSIPDYRCIEKEHACWLIDNRYGDDPDEHVYGLDELKQDMEYNGFKLSQRTLSTAKERAKILIREQ